MSWPTAKVVINVSESALALRMEDEIVTFKVYNAMHHLAT